MESPLLNSLRNQPKIGNPTSNQLGTSVPACDQCGKIHPPLKPGEICPLATVKSPDGRYLSVDKFIINLKNILISQIQKKKIKEANKLLDKTLVEVTKFIENYKE